MKFLIIIGLNFELLQHMKYSWILILLISAGCSQNSEHLIVSGDEQVEYVDQIEKENLTDRNTISWEGKYTGVLDCEDCRNEDFSITLYPDNTYEMTTSLPNEDFEDIEQGSFQWNIDENKIRLNNPDQDEFSIQNGKIIYLNTNIELKKQR